MLALGSRRKLLGSHELKRGDAATTQAMNPEVADGCAAVVCAAPRIAAPAPVVQTVSTTETATVKVAIFFQFCVCC